MNSPQVSLTTPVQPIYEGTTHWDDATAEIAATHCIPTLGWSPLAGGYLVDDANDASIYPSWVSDENLARKEQLHELSKKLSLSAAALAVRYALFIVEHVVVGTR